MDSWRKAARSNPNGACVEIGNQWRKATYSQGASNCAEVGAWRKAGASFSCGNCAEVGSGEQVVAVRDTKQAHLGDDRTVLEFSPSAWRRLLADIKTGRR